jgi:hypothetical protein
MECSFGITGKGYTIIASDSNAARSIVKMKGDEDKMKVLSKHLVMAYNGESGESCSDTSRDVVQHCRCSSSIPPSCLFEKATHYNFQSISRGICDYMALGDGQR